MKAFTCTRFSLTQNFRVQLSHLYLVLKDASLPYLVTGHAKIVAEKY